MKKKNLVLCSLLLVSGLMVGCQTTETSSVSTSSTAEDNTSGSSDNSSDMSTKELVGLYTSPSSMTYMNMRPTYNYYMTYFQGEEIELYSDNTYALTFYSSMFSALTLPEEGNDASGNERENTVETYYGTYSKKTNELDEDSSDLTLEVPNRVVVSYDSTYFVDTAQWNDTMKEATQVTDRSGNVTKTYNSASEYLAAKAFNKKEDILLNEKTDSFDFFTLRETDEADPEVTVSTDAGGLVAAYLSPANLTYMNMRPTYNYYMTIFTQQQILVYEDGTYSFNVFDSCFSGLVLPEEGNDATGSERTNYVQKFSGTMTSQTNELDEDSLDLTLNTPSRVLLGFDSTYSVDSNNWDDEAKENTAVKKADASGNVTETTPYETAADYIAATGFDTLSILASKTTYSFDFVTDVNIILA